MLELEPLIVEELDRLASSWDAEEPAWDEVMRRAKSSRRRLTPPRLVMAVLATAFLVYLAAPAFGLSTPFLDFFSSTPAPKRVVEDFRMQNAAGAHGFGMNPKVLAGQARRVKVYRLRDGTPFPLDVAPRRGGGFCFDFGWGGSCAAPHARVPDERGDHNIAKIEPGEYGFRGSTVIAGYVTDPNIDHLELRFQDDTRVDIPLLWVSPPIDAGFYVDELTPRQHHAGHRPTELLGLDASGHAVAWVRSMFHPANPATNPRTAAELSKKHVILRSGPATIAIAPTRSGGECFWFRNGGAASSGCPPPGGLPMPISGGLSPGTQSVAFWAEVRPRVARVELRFQDRRSIELKPVHGFVLYTIPAAHWPRGHRLLQAIAYSATGKRLGQQSGRPSMPGIYPCSKPIPLGAGLTACP